MVEKGINDNDIAPSYKKLFICIKGAETEWKKKGMEEVGNERRREWKKKVWKKKGMEEEGNGRMMDWWEKDEMKGRKKNIWLIEINKCTAIIWNDNRFDKVITFQFINKSLG